MGAAGSGAGGSRGGGTAERRRAGQGAAGQAGPGAAAAGGAGAARLGGLSGGAERGGLGEGAARAVLSAAIFVGRVFSRRGGRWLWGRAGDDEPGQEPSSRGPGGGNAGAGQEPSARRGVCVHAAGGRGVGRKCSRRTGEGGLVGVGRPVRGAAVPVKGRWEPRR